MDNSIDKLEFVDTPEQLAASMQEQPTTEAPQQESQPVQEVSTPEPVAEPTPTPDVAPAPPQPEQTNVQPEVVAQPEFTDSQMEEAVFSYMSEKLGRDISSLDDFNIEPQEQTALDERVAAIAEFVETTGRSPQDWFRYQSLNPSEMDDLTAVRVDMASKYPNLSNNELNLLIRNQYKFDTEKHGEEQVQLSQLQLKIDADNARNSISEIRERYSAPEPMQTQESIITEDWISEMSQQVNNLEGLEFDLGNNKTFTFGLNDEYKSALKDKNARLDQYFDPFVREDGSWDFDALSSHRAVVDNIDAIVNAAYRQGLGDGQKGLVEKAANVSAASPQQGTSNSGQENTLAQQVKNIMRNTSSKMTFKL